MYVCVCVCYHLNLMLLIAAKCLFFSVSACFSFLFFSFFFFWLSALPEREKQIKNKEVIHNQRQDSLVEQTQLNSSESRCSHGYIVPLSRYKRSPLPIKTNCRFLWVVYQRAHVESPAAIFWYFLSPSAQLRKS